MSAGVFRFKRFEVRNECSAMKVNTDGVLLGAAVRLSTSVEAHNAGKDYNSDGIYEVLDAGTGTGVIALMLAQRLSDMGIDFRVRGIDIDEASAKEAGKNFETAPWNRNLEACNIALKDCEGQFDLIVSNPPYYDDSLKNPDERKNTARHTVQADEEGMEGSPMSYRTILEYAMDHLKDHGEVAMVLPADQESRLTRYARMCGFVAAETLYVSTTDRKAPSRIVIRFRRKPKDSAAHAEESYQLTNKLSILSQGEHTYEYKMLMSEFYLWA